MNITQRIDDLDWITAHTALNERGYICLPDILSQEECHQIAQLYDQPTTKFRSHINMARYNFGRGEYKYFSYPLPNIVSQLRSSFYPHLAKITNEWEQQLKTGRQWPETLEQLTAACHQANQMRPTPLLLRYTKGDYNCLHQDLYGEIHFPLQVIIQLSSKSEYSGGELVLVEQRPRMQSRPIVVPFEQGSAVIIPVRDRPVKGMRGWRRNQMRHGVSELWQGTRHTLGLIFHDAK